MINSDFFPDYVDLWAFLYPADKGYTFDSVINKMIPKYERMRYDRMLLKIHKFESSGKLEMGINQTKEIKSINAWMPVGMKLIGATPCNNTPIIAFPSDHFGIELDLHWEKV